MGRPAPGAGAQEHGNDVEVDLVDAAGPQQVLADAGAEDVHVLVSGGDRCVEGDASVMTTP